MAKVKGLTYTTIRVTKLGGDDDRDAPLPLITPKNAPRSITTGNRLPDASRSIAADALFRASYQVAACFLDDEGVFFPPIVG